jgi:hypothetical protein
MDPLQLGNRVPNPGPTTRPDSISNSVSRLADCLSGTNTWSTRRRVSGRRRQYHPSQPPERRPRLHEDLHRHFQPSLDPSKQGCPQLLRARVSHAGEPPGNPSTIFWGGCRNAPSWLNRGRSIRPAAPSSIPTCIRGYKRPSRSIIVVLLCIALPSNQAIPASSFHIGRQGAEHPRNSTIERARTCRPLDEILRDLGEILPKRAAATATDQIPFVEMRDPDLAKCYVRARLFFRIEKVKQPPLRLFGAPSDGIVQTGSKTHLLAAETASHLRGH